MINGPLISAKRFLALLVVLLEPFCECFAAEGSESAQQVKVSGAGASSGKEFCFRSTLNKGNNHSLEIFVLLTKGLRYRHRAYPLEECIKFAISVHQPRFSENATDCMAPGLPCDHPHADYYREQINDSSAPSMAGVPVAIPAQPQPQPQPTGNAAFLYQWQQRIRPKLTHLLAHLGGQEVAKSLAIAQVRGDIARYI